MNYEAWRITYQSSEQAARAAYTEWQVKLEEVKKWMALAEAAALGFEACQRRLERTEKLECAANPHDENNKCLECRVVPPNARDERSESSGPLD